MDDVPSMADGWRVPTPGVEDNGNSLDGVVLCCVVGNVWKISRLPGNED